jgi:AraC-like DNA-binding protein
MLIFAKIKNISFFAFCIVFLFPDNGLLAKSGKKDYDVVQNEKSKIFIFHKEVDEAKFNKEHLQLYKAQAILAAELDDITRASIYAEYYVKYSSEVGFINSGYFTRFKNSDEFSALFKKYSINFSWLYFFYLFSALIGFFILILLFFKKQNDIVATLLISLFVLINSLFIFHIFLFVTNLKYRTPHILYMSSLTIYLYGPLIYFYFKRVFLNYKFQKWDLMHLLPTVVILIIFLPVFMLSAQEKLDIMLGVGPFDSRPYLLFTVTTKILSLIIYGSLLFLLYIRNKERIILFTKEFQKWLFNLVLFVEVYVVSYLVYGVILMGVTPKYEFLSNIQISVMAVMVLYIGYISYLRPNLFAIETIEIKKIRQKYNKSSLTPSYSQELKEKLLYLLEIEKVYRQNNINLDFISQRLDTTRHNASQVINENFNVSFFELINTYRIEEAIDILKNEADNSMNIIEVAFKVGFNNKVSFNKSFKKHLSQTPSEFINALRLSKIKKDNYYRI